MDESKQAKWYIHLNGVEKGPMSSQSLRGLAEAGKISPDTPIRKEGMTISIPAGKIKGLLMELGKTHPAESQTVRYIQFTREKTLEIKDHGSVAKQDHNINNIIKGGTMNETNISPSQALTNASSSKTLIEKLHRNIKMSCS